MSTPQPSRAALAESEPRSDIDRLRVVMLRLARRIRTSSLDLITPSQLAVLGTIIHHGPVTVGQIAEHEHVTPPSASKIVGALEKLGFVERTVDPNDRRCNPIVATPAGIAHLEGIRDKGRTFLASRFERLDQADIDMIVAAIPALERLLGDPE